MDDPATTYYTRMDSPLGALLLTTDGRSLTGLYLDGQKYFPPHRDDWHESRELDVLKQTTTQLTEYFAHQRQSFDLPLSPQGTDFQKQVWQRLQQIPYGKTIAYGELADRLGKPPGASRAVGAANGRNPIAIIVPCHRVIAANGKLTGYAGGLDRKQWLLHHEQGEFGAQDVQPMQYTLSLYP
ncbi:MAG: methylated-DNA--[protein]-cysteine S-methyltransferase [Elainellaceae cyanobacterium]